MGKAGMNLSEQIPKDFYKIFASKYVDYYQIFLAALYEESGRSYSLLGLTERECRMIIHERAAAALPDGREEQYEEEGELFTRSNMAAVFLNNLERWGWLRRDYDEALDSYVVSFPEYSQLFAELFQKLRSEDGGKERESVLAVYSHLYTYSKDPEKNNQILKSALSASKALLQMLANMQEGMRGYFDELSRQKSFLGIQEVLVQEINNSDSRKYAILTTTDSFYRYKEAVKELIGKNLEELELRRQELWLRHSEYAVAACEEASGILCQIERQFDAIERRYNRLIEQKTVFASRAAARIRYIMQENEAKQDRTAAFARLLDSSGKQEEILGRLAGMLRFTERYRAVGEESFHHRVNIGKEEFSPESVREEEEPMELDEFVMPPLYTQKEIQDFRKENEINGSFTVSADTVRSIEDLEKLFFVWQEATSSFAGEEEILVGDEMESTDGYRFSKLTIR